MNTYQEPKYKIENGKLVNRQSGEAIPDDEPIFILRARDHHAALLLSKYGAMVKDPVHQDAVNTRSAQFHNWKILHPARMKEPDTKKDEGWTSAGNP